MFEVRQRNGEFEAETSRLYLVLKTDGLTLDLESLSGAIGISGVQPRANVEDQEHRPGPCHDASVEDLDTPFGPSRRIRARCRAGPSLDLELAVEIGESWPGVVLELRAFNTGRTALRVRSLDPLTWRADDGALKLPGAPRTRRLFRMGFQSWSPAGWLPLGDDDMRPRGRLLRDLYCGAFTPPSRRGRLSSDFAASLRVPGEDALTLGFLDHRQHLSHVRLDTRGAHPAGLNASAAYEDLSLAPGTATAPTRLWLGLDAPDEDGLGYWAERCGHEMKARTPRRSPSAWCSWYQFFTKVTADDVVRSAEQLAASGSGVETVQIDDGFQAAVGDWLEWSEGFPNGIEPVASAIRASGFRAGLWLAPLVASRASRLAREHPDWLLKTRRGRPYVALINKDWKGRIIYALDPTHPEVLAHLEHVAHTVRRFGFDYLKLDFLYAGVLAGRRHDPALPSAAAYRGAIEAIRRGAGEDVFLVGCGAPLGPSVGLFEAMRIGPDVAPRWNHALADRLLGVRAAPAACNSVRNVLARAALHRRLWLNDPDCVLLRDRDTNLSQEAVRTLASVILLSGGPVVLSDDPEKLSAERQRLAARLLPPLDSTPDVALGDAEIPDQLSQRFADGSVLVLRVNLTRRRANLPIEPGRLGLDGAVRIYDVWREREIDLREALSGSAPPRGCRLLRLVPDDGSPHLLSSTLHLAGGGLETESVQLQPGGGASVSLALPGSRRGRIAVAVPGREQRLCVHVSFQDRLTLRLEPTGVEDLVDMDDR